MIEQKCKIDIKVGPMPEELAEKLGNQLNLGVVGFRSNPQQFFWEYKNEEGMMVLDAVELLLLIENSLEKL